MAETAGYMKGMEVGLEKNMYRLDAKIQEKIKEIARREELLLEIQKSGVTRQKEEDKVRRLETTLKTEEVRRDTNVASYTKSVESYMSEKDKLLGDLSIQISSLEQERDRKIQDFKDALERDYEKKKDILQQRVDSKIFQLDKKIAYFENETKKSEAIYEKAKETIIPKLDAVSGNLSIDNDKILMKLKIEKAKLQEEHDSLADLWQTAISKKKIIDQKQNEDRARLEEIKVRMEAERVREIALQERNIQKAREEEIERERVTKREARIKDIMREKKCDEETARYYNLHGSMPERKKKDTLMQKPKNPFYDWKKSWEPRLSPEDRQILTFYVTKEHHKEFLALNSLDDIQELLRKIKNATPESESGHESDHESVKSDSNISTESKRSIVLEEQIDRKQMLLQNLTEEDLLMVQHHRPDLFNKKSSFFPPYNPVPQNQNPYANVLSSTKPKRKAKQVTLS